MKKIRLTLSAVLAFFAFTTVGHTQISTHQMPHSFAFTDATTVPTLKIAAPDVDEYLYKEQKAVEGNNSFLTPRASALLVPLKQNFFDKAVKTTDADADIYRMNIHMDYAQAINIYSDNFFIPKGGELYIYNSDRSKVIGAFTSKNNKPDGKFASEYVTGEDITIEYYQPKNVSQKAVIEISDVGYFFRDISEAGSNVKASAFNSSGSCHVNVNCSEGDDYRNQQRGVVRLLIRFNATSTGFCSGTLINNADNDATPYIYTAAHCLDVYMKDYSYLSQLIVYFNYESAGCDRPDKEPSTAQTLTGCDKLVMQSLAEENKSGLDVLLLKLHDNVPAEYNAYFCGWTAERTPPEHGVGIHHPSGDIKKISTFTERPKRSALYDESKVMTHWIVYFAKTEHGWGVVEEGSSGSSIFNEDGLIFGSLTSTSSPSCQPDNSKTFATYSRMDLAYDLIQPYLDPHNTGITRLQGMDAKDAGLEDVVKQTLQCDVYPVPAKDDLVVSLGQNNMIDRITVTDNAGRIVYYGSDIVAGKVTIDVSGYTEGVYYVNIVSGCKDVTKKIIIQK
ncbi:MAG: T9SS type A sorting domain-containing protein [Bacteroidales bacterium]|nr:T9SS type A sorting domain-containing protein [Bacteroidales bacterium]